MTPMAILAQFFRLAMNARYNTTRTMFFSTKKAVPNAR